MDAQIPYIALGGGALLFGAMWMFLNRYRKVGPNEALIISGGRGERGRGSRSGGGTRGRGPGL